jgi:hypothetical protein
MPQRAPPSFGLYNSAYQIRGGPRGGAATRGGGNDDDDSRGERGSDDDTSRFQGGRGSGRGGAESRYGRN